MIGVFRPVVRLLTGGGLLLRSIDPFTPRPSSFPVVLPSDAPLLVRRGPGILFVPFSTLLLRCLSPSFPRGETGGSTWDHKPRNRGYHRSSVDTSESQEYQPLLGTLSSPPRTTTPTRRGTDRSRVERLDLRQRHCPSTFFGQDPYDSHGTGNDPRVVTLIFIPLSDTSPPRVLL